MNEQGTRWRALPTDAFAMITKLLPPLVPEQLKGLPAIATSEKAPPEKIHAGTHAPGNRTDGDLGEPSCRGARSGRHPHLCGARCLWLIYQSYRAGEPEWVGRHPGREGFLQKVWLGPALLYMHGSAASPVRNHDQVHLQQPQYGAADTAPAEQAQE